MIIFIKKAYVYILVVEDDKDLNYTVCSYLNQNGFEYARKVRAIDENIAVIFWVSTDTLFSQEKVFYQEMKTLL